MDLGKIMENVIFEAADIKDNKLYFADMRLNYIGSYDILQGKSEYIGSMPDEYVLGKRLVGDIVCDEKKLYIIPSFASKVWRLALDSKVWDSFVICEDFDGTKSLSAALYKNKLFIAGYLHHAITVIENDELKTIYECKTDKILFCRNNVIFDNYLILACYSQPYVYVINMEDLSYSQVIVENCRNGFTSITNDGENIWFIDIEGAYLYKTNVHELLGTKVIKPEVFEIGIKYPHAVIAKDELIFVSSWNGDSILYDSGIKKIKRIVEKKYVYSVKKGNYFINGTDDGETTIVRVEDLKKLKLNIEIKKDEFYEHAMCNISNRDISNEIINEEKVVSLSDFIDVLCRL